MGILDLRVQEDLVVHLLYLTSEVLFGELIDLFERHFTEVEELCLDIGLTHGHRHFLPDLRRGLNLIDGDHKLWHYFWHLHLLRFHHTSTHTLGRWNRFLSLSPFSNHLQKYLLIKVILNQLLLQKSISTHKFLIPYLLINLINLLLLPLNLFLLFDLRFRISISLSEYLINCEINHSW